MFFCHRRPKIITKRDQLLYEQRERFTKERKRDQMVKNWDGMFRLIRTNKIQEAIKFLDDPENAESLEQNLRPWHAHCNHEKLVYEVAKRMIPHWKDQTFSRRDVHTLVRLYCESPDCLFEEFIDLVVAGGGRFDTEDIKTLIDHGVREKEIKYIGDKCGEIDRSMLTICTRNDRFDRYHNDGLFKIATV